MSLEEAVDGLEMTLVTTVEKHVVVKLEQHTMAWKLMGFLRYLRDIDYDDVELEIHADHELPPEKAFCIWVNIFGPWSIMEDLGNELAQHKIHLQHPSYSDRSVPYYNPQALDRPVTSIQQAISDNRDLYERLVSSTDRSPIKRNVQFTW